MLNSLTTALTDTLKLLLMVKLPLPPLLLNLNNNKTPLMDKELVSNKTKTTSQLPKKRRSSSFKTTTKKSKTTTMLSKSSLKPLASSTKLNPTTKVLVLNNTHSLKSRAL